MKYTVDTEAKAIEIHGDFEAKDIIMLDKLYPGFKFRSVEPTITVPSPGIAAPWTPIGPWTQPYSPITAPYPGDLFYTTCEADHQQASAMTPQHLRNTFAQA